MPDLSKINPISAAERRANCRAAGLPLGGGLDAEGGMGPVPEENVAQFTKLRELAHLMSRMGDMAARLHEHADARVLWDMAGKYKRMANELRADSPGSGDTSPQP